MQSNVGKLDAALRVILGIAIMVLGVSYQSMIGVAGLVIFVTAFIHWCPIYRIIGFSTNRQRISNSKAF